MIEKLNCRANNEPTGRARRGGLPRTSRASRRFVVLTAAFVLAGCHQGHGGADLPGDPDDHKPFARIAEGDTVRLNGTEPFWGGTVVSGTFTYTTPERPEGVAVPVERFAGRAGVSFTGERDGQPVALMITEGECSDGMSDRRYPFTATLKLGEEQREGCASTDALPAASGAPSDSHSHS